MTNYICCLCGKKKEGYGNNPAPLDTNKKRCCDDCNTSKVIPERLKGDYKEK